MLKRAAVAGGLVVAVIVAVGCYSPKLASPGFYCHPEDVPACPESQLCVNGRCVNGTSDGSAPDLSVPHDMDVTGDGGSDGGTGGGCDGGSTCATATSLGTINADTGGTQSTLGESEQWLSIQAVENNNGFTGQRMRLTLTLTSPSTTNFDLYVYRNGGGTQPECTTVAGSSTSTGTSDVVSIDWGETDGSVANGAKDDALITIEVRAVAPAMCVAGQKWSLDVKGGP